MTRTSTQPPPDQIPEREPPEGYVFEWVADPDCRVATEEEKAERKCRRPGCQRVPSIALQRGFGRSRQWWLYCDWHTYGRRVEGDVVLRKRLVESESE